MVSGTEKNDPALIIALKGKSGSRDCKNYRKSSLSIIILKKTTTLYIFKEL
jgi:hypothetical protein